MTVIEFGTVAGPAVAASHTVESKLTACPACRFVPLVLTNEMVSSGGVVVGTGVAVTVTPGVGVTVTPGVGVGVGFGVTRMVLVAVLLLGSLSPLVNTVAVVVNEGAAASVTVPMIVNGSTRQLPAANGYVPVYVAL